MSRGLSAAVAGAFTLLLVATGGLILWAVVEEGRGPTAPTFQVMLIKPGNFLAEMVAEATAAGGRVPPDQIDFQAEVLGLKVADVAEAGRGEGFLALLRRSGVGTATLADAVVLRSRDGEAITDAGGDPLADSNMSVLVVPRDIFKMFDDPRSAFLLIRMRIAGLQ
jgi:hypothetical protein